MSLTAKKFIITVLGAAFLVSLIYVQKMEVARKQVEAGMRDPEIAVPASSERCVNCHSEQTPGIVAHWEGSQHAISGVGCYECHAADEGDADAWPHEGYVIATIVTPRDCGRCHQTETEEFLASHHSRAGRILHSLDNRLAEVVEGSRVPYDPHGATPGRGDFDLVNGMAAAQTGCHQCHGSKVAFEGKDGNPVSVDELQPGPNGQPTNAAAVENILRKPTGKPVLVAGTWPNTGIGRKNFDGTEGSCSACHSRHDFSPRRARQPENCGKCHLGPDHPQKEIYEESKHGVAYRDLKAEMKLDADSWVLGEDYFAAPTCATCHMSGNKNNGGRITHDPGIRISWTNRPPISLVMDTINGSVIKESDPVARRQLIQEAGEGFDSWEQKRERMRQVCNNCHSESYVTAFYEQYDDFIHNYNEKFARPGAKLMVALEEHGLRTGPQFDEEIEWIWFYLWHHEGRRARHGASMMAPDYAHWHGTYEVAERFYMELIPEALHLCEEAEKAGDAEAAAAVRAVIEEIMARPEHQWADVERNETRPGQDLEYEVEEGR